MILSLGKPKTKRELTSIHVMDDNLLSMTSPWFIEYPSGHGPTEATYRKQDMSLQEYIVRTYEKLISPVGSGDTRPGCWKSTSRADFSSRLVSGSDVLWIANTTIGQALFASLVPALYQNGWDFSIWDGKALSRVVDVEMVSTVARRKEWLVPTAVLE